VAAIRRLCAVPERLTVTEWADKYRMLPETSTAPGPYRSSVVPYHRRWQDLLADPSVPTVALCWASQTGKSTVLENGLGYRIATMPTPLIVVRPKIDDAESWAKERFVPMVAATPVLRERVRLGRSTESTLRYKRFPGGFLFVASAQSATELASRSAPVVLCDEVDRMEPIPGEGNPVEIVAKRMGASDVGMLVVTSTPRDAETTLIWPYLEGGTDERYHVPCPHCDHGQELLFGGPDKDFGLKWPWGKPEEAQYLCVECKALIPHSAKRLMLDHGEWVATRPENPYPSSHLSGLYSPFSKSSWSRIATEWEAAQGKPADLQVFVNTRLAELWAEQAQQLDATTLSDRLEDATEGTVPMGVGCVTVGVDVQDNRLEAYWWGWGKGLESWLLRSAVIPGDPGVEPEAPASVWRKLDEALLEPLRHVNGRLIEPTVTFVDSGGHHTGKVYRFTNARKQRRVFACKGVGGKLPITGKPTMQTSARVVLYGVGVDTAKDEFLRSQIMEAKPGPGYVHLPHWLTVDQCEQLVSEKRIRRIVKGRPVYEWKPKKSDAATEALDCRNYARAALDSLGAKWTNGLEKMASRMAEPVKVVEPVPSIPETVVSQARARMNPIRPKKGFVNRW
jgi:phage terminase large subunit GpA-like protein